MPGILLHMSQFMTKPFFVLQKFFPAALMQVNTITKNNRNFICPHQPGCNGCPPAVSNYFYLVRHVALKYLWPCTKKRVNE